MVLKKIQYLDHLNKDQITSLIDEYYNGELCRDLISKYHLTCHAPFLYKTFPEFELYKRCPYCNGALIRRHNRRSYRLPRMDFCKRCRHEDNNSRCDCVNCSSIRERRRSTTTNPEHRVVRNHSEAHSPECSVSFKASDLSLMDAAALLGMIGPLKMSAPFQVAYSGSDPRIMERGVYSLTGFAPEDQLKRKIMDHLTSRGVIKVLRCSGPDAIVIADKPPNGVHQPAYWVLNIHDPMGLLHSIEQIARNHLAWPTSWWAQFRDVWFEIALSECLEFYMHQSDMRKLLTSNHSAIERLLRSLLKDFSVSQCYQIIYAGAQQAADFLVLNQWERQQASHYMIRACQRRGDRARIEGWVLKGFPRDFNLPQSCISRVFFDHFLRIGERGFTQCPFSAQQINITCG